ncbi:MAG: glycosyltransferase family 39 protein [Candidatus Gracilibacteria bacterium]
MNVKKINKEVFIVLGLVVVGAFLRFYMILELPCGLFPDQAISGLDSIRFSNGLISPIIGGNEGLFVYITALSHLLFGTGMWQIFIVSAFLGTATVATTYLAVKEFFGRNIAFISSFILAVSGWHIALSRNGFRAILVPLIISLLAYLLAKSMRSKTGKEKSLFYSLTAGVFALGFYTYNAYVLFVFGVGLVSLFLLFKYRRGLGAFIKNNKKSLLLALGAFTLVILPIALFILIFPEKYFMRAGQVFVETGSLMLQNFWQTVVGIFTHGDANWRHNPSGEAMLFVLLVPFFFGGFLYSLYKRRVYLVMVVIFLVMFLPAILTNEGTPPHGLRLIGIIPAIFVFAAIGLSFLLKPKNEVLKLVGCVLLVIILGFTAVNGYQNYFKDAPNSLHYYNDFRCDLTGASSYVKTEPNTVVIADYFTFQTIRYLLYPLEIDYIEPASFVENFNETDFSGKSLMLLSSFREFDQATIDFLLSKNFIKEEIKNRFGSIDYYIFYKRFISDD